MATNISNRDDQPWWRVEVDRLKKEISRLTDTLDLALDEFRRIETLCKNEVDGGYWPFCKEISGVCQRSRENIRQKVPVIEQRDMALSEAAHAEFKLDMLREFFTQGHMEHFNELGEEAAEIIQEMVLKKEV